MKGNETPQLDGKWWSKNKPKTMGKTGLGDALKDFEIARDKMDWDKSLKALSDVKRSVANAVKKANKTVHKNAITVLKKYPKEILKEEKRIQGLKQAEAAKGAGGGAGGAAPKQKIGKGVVIWKKDLGAEITKRYKPDWLKDMKGYEFKLTLNEDLLDVLEKEGDYVTPQQMVDDANALSDKIVGALAQALINTDQKVQKEKDEKKAKALIDGYSAQVAQAMKASGKSFETIPRKRWAAFVKRKQQYKDYKIKTGFDIALGSLGVIGGAVGVAGSVATGGASLVLGIISLVRGVAALADKIKDTARDAEKVEKVLKGELETLWKSYRDADGKAKKSSGAKEVGASVLKGILGTDTPFLATLPKANKNFDLWGNKVAGLAVAGRKLSAAIIKTMGQCDKLEQAIKKSDGKDARKYHDKLVKARKALDKGLNDCEAMMTRVGNADKNSPNLKKVLDALNADNPKYAVIFEKAFPAAVNLTLAGANAGVGFKEAANTAETLNTALGLFNDIASEGKDQLEDAIG